MAVSASLAETGTDWGDTRSARIPKSASAEGACLPASVCVLAPSRAGRSSIPSIDDRYATLAASLSDSTHGHLTGVSY
jgi:hypothetical protein